MPYIAELVNLQLNRVSVTLETLAVEKVEESPPAQPEEEEKK